MEGPVRAQQIRLERLVEGENRLYTIRTEDNEHPTLIRSWGPEGQRQWLSVIDTYGSPEHLELAVGHLVRRLMSKGYRVTQGRKVVSALIDTGLAENAPVATPQGAK